MPTTSNFGWNTPADTDLVKDGAAAIRTLGNNIDASLVDLKGGTTGQVLAKASNADLDYTWSNVDPLTILDAKGDLITATAADTPARLAVGANGTYLQADSTTATGLKWATVSAGGMTELASGTLSGSTVTLSSISGSYKNLQLTLRNVSATTNSYFAIRINGITAGYNITGTYVTTSSQTSFGSLNGSRIDLTADAATVAGSAYTDNSWIINLYDYATTNTKKGDYIGFWNSSADNEFTVNAAFASGDSSAAITSIAILTTGGTFDNGTYVLWGIS